MDNEDRPTETEDDPTWIELLSKPATRGELLETLQIVHAALLSHSLFEAALLRGTRENQEELAVKAIDVSGEILQTMRKLTTRWNALDA